MADLFANGWPIFLISGGRSLCVQAPVPSIQEQLNVVARCEGLISSVDEQEKSIELSLKQASAQRQNILRAAFSGELVPQDPNDEPASVLLERIRAERAARSVVKKPDSKKRSRKQDAPASRDPRHCADVR